VGTSVVRPWTPGALIDAHAAVMRINGAPTKGYEVDVGKRTTFRFQQGGYFGWRESESEAGGRPSYLLTFLHYCPPL
jgi:hypothetical protein